MRPMEELVKIAEGFEIELPPFQVGYALPIKGEIAAFIDHTILKAEATEQQVRALCQEAATSHFAAVCINPGYVPLCSELLADTEVDVCTVIGFPLGANSAEIKVAEAKWSVEHGATEVDLVLNIGAMRSGNYDLVYKEIAAVKNASGTALVKVIFENCYLTNKEKILACLMCKEAGVEFVKTSTGFGSSGATAEDVHLMRCVVGPNMGVKAAGGIRTYADALRMVEAGADRIGTSAGVAILAEAEK